jgi:trk system potassium uptake protein TrkH
VNRSDEARRLRALNGVTATLGLFALVIVALRFGFPDLRVPPAVSFAWSAVLPVGLFVESLYRLLIVRDPWRYLRRHPLRYLILASILLELSGVATWSLGVAPDVPAASFLAGELYVAVLLVGFAADWAKAAVLANRWLAEGKVPVLALPSITFGLAILAGTAVLMAPGVQARPLTWIDALFTSTSALCVTGLVTVDVASSLTPLGCAALAGLIQIGGLGTMTVLGSLALWQRGEIRVGERVAMSQLVGGAGLAETRRLVGVIVRTTLAVELAGAVALWLLWRDRVPHALLQGVFHSISAFCNAGFTLWSDSLASFRSDAAVLVVFMLLILAGGIGFPVLADLARAAVSRVVPWRSVEPLQPGSRLALRWSGALVALGAVAFLVDGRLSGTRRSLADSLLQSVSTRTAGFEVEPQAAFGVTGLVATVVLMVIGASAQSTGGGLKTNVVARLFARYDAPRDRDAGAGAAGLSAWAIAALLSTSYLLLGAGTAWLLARLDGLALPDALFEAFSALGTVGLSRGVTTELSTAAKVAVTLLMFSGRVLYPTLVLLLIRRRGGAPAPVAWA